MHPHDVARVRWTLGALAPYRWEAVYRDGTRLQEHDVAGHHRAAEIDRARLVALRLHGHPSGVLEAICAVPPDEVILRAKTRLSLGPGGQAVTRWILYGFRFGLAEAVLAIDEVGRVAPWREPVTDIALAAARLRGGGAA